MQRTSNLRRSLPLCLLFFLFFQVLAASASPNFSKLKLSQERVTIGEQFSFEGEVKNIDTKNVTITFLSIYVSRRGLEVVEVKPFKPLKNIKLQPEETFNVRFDLKPKRSGKFNIGFIATVEDGPVLQSQTLEADVIGEEGIIKEGVSLLLLLGAFAIGGLFFVVWKLGKKENIFSLAYWREKWLLTLAGFSYICIQVFLPYLPRTVQGVLILYIELVGWWLITPIILILHGYLVRHVMKSFLIAFIPFLAYGIQSEFGLYYIGIKPAISLGFILYEAYLGASLGLIGAASAFIHSRRWMGIALLAIGWVLLLLRPSWIFF